MANRPGLPDITFKTGHLMTAHVEAAFKTFNAGIYITGRGLTICEIDLWIDTSSITAGNVKRVEDLKGSDFFKYNQLRN